MKITLFKYIADCNPQEAYDLMLKEGYKLQHGDKVQLETALANFVNKNGEEGLETLKSVHPDKELFENVEPLQPIISSCDGCALKSADATKPETGKKFNLSEKTINVMIISGAAVFVLTSLVILIRKAK